jgi:DNA-directed RNA polymerase subunit RPC12/RpoP
VLEIVAKVKRWLNPAGLEMSGPILFAVPCACGQVVDGERKPAHQLALCPKCGEKVFVFPKSSFPPVLPAPGPQGRSSAPSTIRASWRRKVSLAGGVLVLAALVAWIILVNQGAEEERLSSSPTEDLATRLDAARIEMGQGKYYTALEHLDAARRSRAYEDLPSAGKRTLEQLRLQTSLLADLREVPLSEIVRHAGDVPQAEWEKVFAHRYRGRAVLFDARVHRDATRLRLDYRLFAGGREARVEVSDLDLLAKFPIEQPVRLIFGARLAGISGDPNGALVVHLDPRSGVLMTDLAALKAAAPVLADDPELAQVMNRQQDLLNKLP